MNMNGGFPSNLLILDGSNLERWSVLMKTLFGAQEVLEIVPNGYEDLAANPTEVQRKAFRDSKKKDRKALFYILQNVDTHHFEKISKVTRFKEARDILDKYHDGGEKTHYCKIFFKISIFIIVFLQFI